MKALALALLASCAAAPVVPAVVVSGCSLKVHPPTQPVLHAVANCTALYAFCLTAEDTRALILWRAEVESWEDTTWNLCQRFPASKDP